MNIKSIISTVLRPLQLKVAFLKMRIMDRYCPDYFERMPLDNTQKHFQCVVYTVSGYWGNKWKAIKVSSAYGLLDAYRKARWMALVEQWKRPNWLFGCGVYYGVHEIKEQIWGA